MRRLSRTIARSRQKSFESVRWHRHKAPPASLKVADAAGEGIDPSHHQNVSIAQEVEHHAQFLPVFRGRAPALLSAMTS
jgi:hypothetical protein